MSDTHASSTQTTLPATPRQIAYARKIASSRNVVLPSEAQQDRQTLSRWIDAHLQLAPAAADNRPSSRQVAFAERIARIKRRAVPDECFRDRRLMSRWIDCNKP